MGVFDLLIAEHDRIMDAFRTTMSEGKKGDAFEELRVRLETHMEGEEEHVYPQIRAAGLNDQVLEALQEHHVARIVLGELEDMSDREEAWIPKLKVLADLLERHIRGEERSLFPSAKKKIGRARQEELEAEFGQFASSSVRAGTSLPRSESPFYREV